MFANGNNSNLRKGFYVSYIFSRKTLDGNLYQSFIDFNL